MPLYGDSSNWENIVIRPYSEVRWRYSPLWVYSRSVFLNISSDEIWGACSKISLSFKWLRDFHLNVVHFELSLLHRITTNITCNFSTWKWVQRFVVRKWFGLYSCMEIPSVYTSVSSIPCFKCMFASTPQTLVQFHCIVERTTSSPHSPTGLKYSLTMQL